jgi:murein DD-endopeptidase MepM/ murein hydrolase activator NlpD
VLTLDVKSHGVCSHDDDLLLMRFALPSRHRAAPSSTPRRGRRRFLFLVLLVPLLSGAVVAPGTRVAGDDLSDAIAKQKAIEKQVARQKSQIAELNALQHEVAGEIARTSKALNGINADLGAVRKQVAAMVKRVDTVRSKYEALVGQLKILDLQLAKVVADEAAKRVELGERKAMLADRLRNAYDTDKTSLLETFLSGASFTDVLTQVSYYLDVSEQDKALAEQIMRDQETLASLHQTVADTRTSTDELRKQTASQKRALDAQLGALKQAQAALHQLEVRTAHVLAAQKAAYAAAARNKAALKKSLARAASAQRALARKISAIVRQQASSGRIPSQYNGSLHWPMGGTVSQNFGCTGMSWEPPLGDCAHYHQGIDIVAPFGSPVRASGAGRVAYIGWNWADGADPAWIVIIAHSGSLETWYAHMQPRYPVSLGEWVNAGEVVGYEGNTGHSTGAHLHWAVRRNGVFVNPRLFL